MGLYVGDSDNLVLMLGDTEVSAAYLGDTQVYPMSPFAVSPSTLRLSNIDLTAQIRIKSPEPWTITENSGGWLTLSANIGSAGVTVVTVTATVNTATRNASITITTANYTKTVAVEQEFLYGFRIENRSANTNTITSLTGWDSSIEYNLNDGSGWQSISGSSITIPANGSANLRGNMAANTVMPQFRATEDWAMIGEVAALHNYSWTSTSGSMSRWWENISNIKEVDLDFSTLTNIGDWNRMFYQSGVESVSIDLRSLTDIGPQYLIAIAQSCISMTYFHLNISSLASIQNNAPINGMCANSTSLVTAVIDYAPNANFDNWAHSNCFSGCSSLVNAPDLRNITQISDGSAYYYYNGCTLLNKVIAPSVAAWVSSNFSNWLSECAATGIVVMNPNTTGVPVNNYSGIPPGWTRVNSYYSVTLSGSDEPFDYATSDGRSGSIAVGDTVTLRLDYPQTLSITTAGPKYHLYINGTVDKGNGPTYTLDYLDLANGDTLTVVFTSEPS